MFQLTIILNKSSLENRLKFVESLLCWGLKFSVKPILTPLGLGSSFHYPFCFDLQKDVLLEWSDENVLLPFTIYQNCSLNLCWFLFWILAYGDASHRHAYIYIQLLSIRKGMYRFSGYFGGPGLCTSFCCTHSEEDMHVAEALETLRYPK